MSIGSLSSVPDVPEGLVNACAARETVLFAGAGLGARSGLPTWAPFSEQLLEWAGAHGVLTPEALASARTSIKDGHASSVVDAIVTAADPRLLNAYLKETFQGGAPLSEAHRILGTIPFAAALTTNFDSLLEQAFPDRQPLVFTPQDTGALLDAHARRAFYVLKLFGDLDRPETVAVSPAQFEDSVAENQPFSSYMDTLLFTNTLFFVGASFAGIENYLRGIRLRPQRGPRSHYALVAVQDDGWQTQAQVLERRYGIVVIPYLETPEYAQVDPFLADLANRVRETSSEAAPGAEAMTRLKRVVLQNIGPFGRLDVELDPNWNILLGDNGVGKSNILRAIALGIGGGELQQHAHRLIKTGQTSATIGLTTDRNDYRAEVLLTPAGRAEVISTPGAPLEAERWLVMGFPPLRAASQDRPRAPEPLARSRPSIEDLEPLLAGAVDPRLDRLKQWIVNLDYQSKDEQLRTGAPGKYGKLLERFFEVIGSLAEGVTIERGEINPSTYEVTVITDDGKLPIEAISQGMTSLIGWVGILLQRLYEVYDDVVDPTQSYALVLIDEIDAHLHPAWQRTLVSRLSELFPNVQFVATTHSPLIVSGMPVDQIIRLERDIDGQVERVEVSPEQTMGRADQILRGDLFGLQTTLGTTTEAKMRHYESLLGNTSRSETQEREYQVLNRELRSNLRLEDDNRALLQTQAALLEQLGAQIQADSPEQSQALLASAQQLRSNLSRTAPS